jgi:hypothetical protein
MVDMARRWVNKGHFSNRAARKAPNEQRIWKRPSKWDKIPTLVIHMDPFLIEKRDYLKLVSLIKI